MIRGTHIWVGVIQVNILGEIIPEIGHIMYGSLATGENKVYIWTLEKCIVDAV